MPFEPSKFPIEVVTISELIGALTCGFTYWPVVSRVQRATVVVLFPPGGHMYWLSWLLPLALVAAVVTIAGLIWRSGRAAVFGFGISFMFVGAAMCMLGYSVDNMPYYM